MKIGFKLTEEFSRWAFEVQILKLIDWHIIFRNPTAGPWKRIESKDSKGRVGEVYRFNREEKRPDIIIVNDKLKTIIIFEAKDSLQKRLNKSQISKSAKVVIDMSNVLSQINSPYWGDRKRYKMLNGLLWGAEEHPSEDKIKEAFMLYSEAFQSIDPSFDEINQIGIEAQKIEDKIDLNYFKSENNLYLQQLVKSISKL